MSILDSNPDLVERDPDLLAAEARALLNLGRISEAQALNDKLLIERNYPTDLDLDIKLALQSGDWERFPAIVGREWPRKQEHGAKELIRLASLAAEADATASRAFELLNLAAEKGSEDPYILVQAAGLSYRLGREGEQPARWIAKAVELSPDGGPAQRIELRELVEEWGPKHQESRRTAEELLLKGEAPLHLISNHLNIPLSILLIDIPRRNEHIQDGRRRTIIPIMSGARQPIILQPEWVVGFDITSLMVLENLGILREALTSFRQAVIAPDTMVVLLNERNRVRFHQPSLVKRAEEIRHLIDKGVLRSMNVPLNPPESLVQEVGRELAQLLTAASEDHARVVRPHPITKLESFGNEIADLGEYESLVLSTLEFERLLYKAGLFDATAHERASRYLSSQDRETVDQVDALVLKSPLYIDDLALTYLQGAGLLSALEDSRLDLRIHPSVREEKLSLIESDRERKRLEDDLEKIRITLRDILQVGSLEFLHRRSMYDEDEGRVIDFAPTLGEFMQDSGNCDVVVIDDRFSQKYGKFMDRSRRERPVVGVFDILKHLETQGIITHERRYSLLHKLRSFGFSLLPVEPEELLSHLLAAQGVEEENFQETAELRILRQTLMRIRSLEMLTSQESRFLGQLQIVSVMVIRQIWADEAIPKERALRLTRWAWSFASPSLWGWVKVTPESDAGIKQSFVHHLGLLLAPLPIEKERLAVFLDWVQEEVLDALLPANAEILDILARQIGEQVESWSLSLAEQDEGSTIG